MALSADMSGIVSRGMSDASALNDEERERLIAWYTQHIIAKDNFYHQYLEGVLPHANWVPHEKVAIGLLQYESFLKAWDAGFMPVSDEFREYLEQLRSNNVQGSWTFALKARIYD